MTLENLLSELFARRGIFFYAIQHYQEEGLPEGVAKNEYLVL